MVSIDTWDAIHSPTTKEVDHEFSSLIQSNTDLEIFDSFTQSFLLKT